MKICLPYLTLTVGLFAIEMFLALKVRDDFFRPFVGDALVVMLIYAGLRTVWLNPGPRLVWGICAFAFAVEGLQYLGLVEKLGWENRPILATLVGQTFSWLDLVAYSVGSLANLKLRYLHRIRKGKAP